MRFWIRCAVLLAAASCVHGQGVITTIAGSARLFPPAGLAPTSAAVNPTSVAVRKDGTVFISDPLANVILQVSSSGTLTVAAGNGLSGFSGDSGPATSASIYAGAVALNSAGLLFFTDIGRIRKVAADGTISTVASVSGVSGGSAIAIDSAENIFVSANNQILRVSAGKITTFAGNGTTAYSGDGGPATSAGLNLFRAGLAVDKQGNVYISDPGNQRIRRVDATGIISTFAGNGTSGPFGDGGPATKASLGFPEGLALDTDGSLIIADTVNNRVRRVDLAGNISTLAGNGNNVFQSDGVPAVTTGVGCVAVAVSAAGDIFVADQYNFRVRRVDRSTGIVATFAGSGNGANPNDGGLSVNGGLSQPEGVAADRNGNVYIADTRNNRIRRVDPRGVISTIAGNGAQGYAGDGGPGPSARVEFPVGIALSPAGELYFTDLTHVRKLNSAGVISTFAGALDNTEGFSGDGGPATAARLLGPSGLAFDAGGNLFIADSANCRIRRVTPGGSISTVAGNGSCTFAGDNGLATQASLNYPIAVAVDSAGSLFIADLSNYRVRKVGPDGIITTVAGNGTFSTSGDNGPATSATLAGPSGLAFDKAGNLYIASYLNPTIRRVSSGTITAVASAGRGFSGDGGPAASARLNIGPFVGLAFDNLGNLFIPDSGNDRIRAILANPPSAQVSSTSLQFQGASGSVVPPPQRVAIETGIPAMAFSARAVVSQTAKWLQVAPASGFSPTSLVITANPSQLPPGTYQGTVEISVPNGSPAALTVSVKFAVGPTLPARLNVDSPRLTLSTSPSASATGVIAVNNNGGGVLSFTSAATTDFGGNWLTTTPASGVASPASPAAVVVTASPGSLAAGVYTGRVTIASSTSGEQSSVPVTMILSAVQPRIQLTQTGIGFQASANAATPPSQTLGVLNRGQGGLSWVATAQTLTGSTSWLSVSPSTGTVARPNLDTSIITVTADATSLAPGLYYGQIMVSTAAGDNAQSVTVVLNVVDNASAPAFQLQPVGLIFTSRTNAPPGSQDVFLRNTGTGPLTYNSAQLTLDGSSWLQYLPSNASVSKGQPQRIVVQPGPLPAGVYDGSITLIFEDGSTKITTVKTVVAAAPCTPTRLVMMPVNVEPFFTAIRYLPSTIEVQVVDDCGIALTADRSGASLTMTFSSGDRTINLMPIGGGHWTATWQPVNGSAGPVFVSLKATLPATGGTPLSGSVDLEAELTGSVDVPVAAALLNAASFALDSPVAPASLVSLFGANLAGTSTAAESLPLGTTLGGTRVRLGSSFLPMAYAGTGQVNAQIPRDVPLNAELQLSVIRGSAISLPQPVVTAAAAPGIFSQDQSGTGSALVVDGLTNHLNGPDFPAHAGDTVVVYCTGLGPVTPSPSDGVGAPGVAITDNPVTLTVSGKPAQVTYSGLTPGFPGLYQVNAVIPSGTATGDHVPLLLTIGRQTSLPVTITLR